MAKAKKQKEVKQKAKLFIAGIAGGGSMPVQFATSLLATIGDLNKNGIETDVDLRPGGPYIVKERNIAISRFLQSNATHMLFIDTDLAWNPSAPYKMLKKMCEHSVQMLGGLYRYKFEREDYPCQLYINDETGEYIEREGMYLAAGLPTGFMMFTRDLVNILIQEYPETAYEVKDSFTGEVHYKLHCLFDTLLHNNEWWGEDYVFCRRWTALGGECWAYPDIDFAHISFNHGFVGNFEKNYQKNKPELLEKHKNAAKRQDMILDTSIVPGKPSISEAA